MGLFLKRAFLFFLPIVILAYGIDLFLSKQLASSHEEPSDIEVWNDIYNKAIKCDLAIYGSSRAIQQFSSKILEDSLKIGVYNFGINGHNFWLQHLRHQEYLKNNPAPRQIVLSVDAFTLVKRKDLFTKEQFLPFLLWNKNINKYTTTFEGYNIFDYTIPLVRYFGATKNMNSALKNWLAPSLKYTRYHGSVSYDLSWNKDLENAQKLGNGIIEIQDSASKKLFEAFIDECKQAKIKVMMVYTPEYIEGQSLIKNRQAIIDTFKRISLTHDIPFWDYSQDSSYFNKKYFYNTLHLNTSGATKFTKQFVGDLKREQMVR